MRKFDDIPHHQAEMRRTIKYAERERDRAELIHKRAIYALANISNEEISDLSTAKRLFATFNKSSQ
jgi:hypothetical protein